MLGGDFLRKKVKDRRKLKMIPLMKNVDFTQKKCNAFGRNKELAISCLSVKKY